jgi:hypothetical protein
LWVKTILSGITEPFIIFVLNILLAQGRDGKVEESIKFHLKITKISTVMYIVLYEPIYTHL